MRQFIEGADWAWEELRERAESSCVRFKDRKMPPKCTPHHAHVGFEIDPRTRMAILLVQHGVRYAGTESEISDWLDQGEKRFPDFEQLKAWVKGPLKRAFAAEGGPGGHALPALSSGGHSSDLTDMAVVHEGIRHMQEQVFIDEAVFFELLRQRVLGQEDALKGLAAVIGRHLARKRPARPAVIFAVGPSGVGKTRSAEMVPQVLQALGADHTGYQFLRLDMTEYQEAHRVSQLIGAPQGYVGHGDGSALLDALGANPRTIVLFDEIEKAHPSILRVLMNAMDAGRMSTASRANGGREIDCRFAVFMFTSNLDAKDILDELASRSAFGNRSIEDDVCRRRLHAAGMAPEIVGRIGRFLVYRTLSPEIRAEIMALTVSEVADEYGLHIKYIEPTVIVELMKKIHSQSFGARPARFLVDDLLGGILAKAAQASAKEALIVSGPPFTCSPCASRSTEGGGKVTQKD